jgi:eukaryotic-like serine/threonine-protein kinase
MDLNEPLEPVLLEAALKLAAEQRGPYLDRACAGDLQMRHRVQLLLDASDRAGTFMREPAAPGRTIALAPSPAEKPGDRIGRYKLLEQIGEGGCGLVYVAEQEEPVRRRVALKVIKLGMDTKQVIARFDAERQALALMDHPNIARVLDAGATEKGRPYFVMELVRGIKITDYCDQNQLSPRQRLEVFIQVCRAVQHAHQKGIIHRDIKPSNILVASNDGVPAPKVIDFGIAKATQGRLTDQTVYTAFEQFIGTPAYMSPEQTEMSLYDIDTRTDIYSLGVLLYELLTGKTPFDAKELMASGFDAMRKTIREKEPVRPSTRLSTMMEGELTTTARQRHTEAPKLIHLLRGDLDWIVMKCLEKDRTRRYDTANGLAMDIQRHLSNEPIVARPQSPGYRFQKMVRRNKLAFIAAGGIAAALLLGLAGVFWQWRLAERNHQESEANLYAADMSRAEQALDDGDLLAARGLLKRHADQTRLHGFEWRYLWKRCLGDFAYSFPSHSNGVLKLVFSPDGNTLAALQANGTLRLLNVVDRTERECLSNVTGLAGFTRDGQELVMGLRENNSVRLVRYDPVSRRITASFTNESRLGWLPNLLPDGRSAVIAGAGKELSLVDVGNGAVTGKVQLPSRFFMRWAAVGEAGAVSGDGRWVFSLDNADESGTAENLSIRELASGKVLATYRDDSPGTPKSGLGDRVYILRFLPGGTTAIWSTRDGFLRRWRWTDAGSKPLTQPGHRGIIWDISCSPDGRRVATVGDDQTVRLWNAEDLSEVRSLRGHTRPVRTVAFSPDSHWLASGGDDGSVKLWNLSQEAETGEPPVLAARHLANRLVFAPDGRTLALGTDDDAITTISLETGQKIGSFKDLFFPDRFTSDGTRIIGYAGVGNVPAGKVEHSIPVPDHTAYPWTHDVSPDGRWLLRSLRYPGKMDSIELVDVARGAVITNFVPSTLVLAARFTRDGRTVLASFDGGQLEWWEVTPHGLAARRSVQFDYGSRALAISPDGATVALGGPSRISLVDYRTGAIRRHLFGHSDDVNGLDFSPDGGTLASSTMNGTIKLWNLQTMQEVCTIPFDVKPAPGKELGVDGLGFAPDGNSVWAFSRSGVLKSWHAATLEEIAAAERDDQP